MNWAAQASKQACTMPECRWSDHAPPPPAPRSPRLSSPTAISGPRGSRGFNLRIHTTFWVPPAGEATMIGSWIWLLRPPFSARACLPEALPFFARANVLVKRSGVGLRKRGSLCLRDEEKVPGYSVGYRAMVLSSRVKKNELRFGAAHAQHVFAGWSLRVTSQLCPVVYLPTTWDHGRHMSSTHHSRVS
jgi:hypothetical protein